MVQVGGQHRDGMYELQAIKAVKMRDTPRRLQLCAVKVDAGLAAGCGFINLTDPLRYFTGL
jgi:hypothetical protein